MCLQEDGDTKKLLAAGAAYKKNVCLWIFSKPGHSGSGRTCFGKLNSVIYKQSIYAKFVLSHTFVYKAITPLKNSQNLTTLYCIVTRNSDKGLKRVTHIQCSQIFSFNIVGNPSEGYPFYTKLLPRDHHAVVLRQAAFQY